ncbi:MAG: hypothetical protein M1839_008707 [Geoglossum umbratile]|nr:MAG: hypothetical protein M1839_008707 [Geoglossum umbratile]
MTIEMCAARCAAFTWFGAEYGRECYCGDSLNTGSALAATQSDCNMVCPGNTLEFCGAGNRLQMYKAAPSSSTSTTTNTAATTSTSTTSSATPTGPIVVPGNVNFTFIGCYTEAKNTRALSQRTYANDSMTVPSCLSFCSSYTYAGLEYARECYCGNTINTGSVIAALTDCSMTCKGDPKTYCGAGSRLQMYQLNSKLNTTSTASFTSSSASSPTSSAALSTSVPMTSDTTTALTTSSPTSALTSSTTAASTTSSSATSTPPWQYLGCANETNPRALPGASTSGSMTIEKCQSYCLGANYPLAGLEYGGECYCGTGLQNNSTLGFNGCNMACSANSSQICGGSSRLSVYNYTLFVPTIIVPSVGTYQFQGCYTEGSGTRALSGYTFSNSTGMTAELCVGTCKTKGFSCAGAEYGRECYCGNVIDASAAKVPDTDCKMPCSGNQREYCGAGNRLVVYRDI